MRTTLALDDDLLAKAQALTGLQGKSALVREALMALIQRESARGLVRLGSSERALTVQELRDFLATQSPQPQSAEDLIRELRDDAR